MLFEEIINYYSDFKRFENSTTYDLYFILFLCILFFLLMSASAYLSYEKNKNFKTLSITASGVVFLFFLYLYISVLTSLYKETSIVCCNVKHFEYSKVLTVETLEVACKDGKIFKDKAIFSLPVVLSDYSYAEYTETAKPYFCFETKGNRIRILTATQ